jgi:DNA-binding PadR family transcriptional regulator
MEVNMTSAHALHFGGLRGHHFHPFDPRIHALRAMTGRGPGRHGRHGGPPFGGPGFGPPGGPFGGGRGGRRRMRRGDVRAAMLVLLDEQPLNGYGLMQEIEQRSGGAWRPSPGSVYPALSQLEDEGLVKAEEVDGRKQYALTDEGRAYVAENRERLGEPWAEAGQQVGEERLELRGLLWQLGAAAMQVGTAGTDAQVAAARQILVDARKAIYRLLAEDEEPDDGGDDTPPAAA